MPRTPWSSNSGGFMGSRRDDYGSIMGYVDPSSGNDRELVPWLYRKIAFVVSLIVYLMASLAFVESMENPILWVWLLIILFFSVEDLESPRNRVIIWTIHSLAWVGSWMVFVFGIILLAEGKSHSLIDNRALSTPHQVIYSAWLHLFICPSVLAIDFALNLRYYRQIHGLSLGRDTWYDKETAIPTGLRIAWHLLGSVLLFGIWFACGFSTEILFGFSFGAIHWSILPISLVLAWIGFILLARNRD